MPGCPCLRVCTMMAGRQIVSDFCCEQRPADSRKAPLPCSGYSSHVDRVHASRHVTSMLARPRRVADCWRSPQLLLPLLVASAPQSSTGRPVLGGNRGCAATLCAQAAGESRDATSGALPLLWSCRCRGSAAAVAADSTLGLPARAPAGRLMLPFAQPRFMPAACLLPCCAAWAAADADGAGPAGGAERRPRVLPQPPAAGPGAARPGELPSAGAWGERGASLACPWCVWRRSRTGLSRWWAPWPQPPFPPPCRRGACWWVTRWRCGTTGPSMSTSA